MPCACSSPAAPASSARTSSSVSPRRAHDVVVLDKLTYSGNPANLEGVEHRFVAGRHRRSRGGRRRCAGLRGDPQLRRRVPCRPLDPRVLRLRPHAGARDAGRCSSTSAPPASASSRSRRTRSTATSRAAAARPRTMHCGRRAPTARPRPAATCSCSATCGRTASTRSITRGANTYGPNQYPEKFLPLFITNALDGEPLPVYGDGRQRREWLHVDDHCAGNRARARARRSPARSTTSAATSARTSSWCGGSSSSPAPTTRSSATSTDRPGHDRRYSIDDSKLRGLGWSPRGRARGRARRHVRVVPRQPRPGGSRSSRASTARTTSSSTPTGSALARLVVLALRAGLAELRARPLDRLGGVDVRQALVAAAELDQRAADVVVRVRLVELARALAASRAPAGRSAAPPRSGPGASARWTGRSASPARLARGRRRWRRARGRGRRWRRRWRGRLDRLGDRTRSPSCVVTCVTTDCAFDPPSSSPTSAAATSAPTIASAASRPTIAGSRHGWRERRTGVGRRRRGQRRDPRRALGLGERVAQGRRRSAALLSKRSRGILRQRSAEAAVERRRQRRVPVVDRRHRLVDVRCGLGGRRVALEGPLAGEQLEGDDAEGVAVARRAGRLAPGLLGREVARGADDGARPR